MTDHEAHDAATLGELAARVNQAIGAAVTHPLLPHDARRALELTGTLLSRMAAELDRLRDSHPSEELKWLRKSSDARRVLNASSPALTSK